MLALPQLGIMFNDNANQAVAWIRLEIRKIKQKFMLTRQRLPKKIASF